MAAMGRGEGPEGLNRKEKGLMDLENIMLSEISQSEKDKYYMISLIRGI